MPSKELASGAEKRRRKKEKDARNASILNKMSKLDTFYRYGHSSAEMAPDAAAPSAARVLAPGELSGAPKASVIPNVEQDLSQDFVSVVETNENSGEFPQVQQQDDADFPLHADDFESTPEVLEFDNDPAAWPEPPTEALRDFWTHRGRFEQNIENRRNFQETETMFGQKRRALTRGIFYRSLHNREEKLRSWLIYSTEAKAVFCGPCKLFSAK